MTPIPRKDSEPLFRSFCHYTASETCLPGTSLSPLHVSFANQDKHKMHVHHHLTPACLIKSILADNIEPDCTAGNSPHLADKHPASTSAEPISLISPMPAPPAIAKLATAVACKYAQMSALKGDHKTFCSKLKQKPKPPPLVIPPPPPLPPLSPLTVAGQITLTLLPILSPVPTLLYPYIPQHDKWNTTPPEQLLPCQE